MLHAYYPRSLKTCLLLLALMGIVVKGLIPVGFMPDFSLQTGSPMVICSGFGQKTIYIDENGKSVPVNEHQSKTPCDFAYTPTIEAPTSVFTIFSIMLSSLFLPVVQEAAHVRPYANAPPITGPPTIL